MEFHHTSKPKGNINLLQKLGIRRQEWYQIPSVYENHVSVGNFLNLSLVLQYQLYQNHW